MLDKFIFILTKFPKAIATIEEDTAINIQYNVSSNKATDEVKFNKIKINIIIGKANNVKNPNPIIEPAFLVNKVDDFWSFPF